MYQYSLDAFNTFLQKAIDRTQVRRTRLALTLQVFRRCIAERDIPTRPGFQETDDVKERTERLIASIRLTIFRWVCH